MRALRVGWFGYATARVRKNGRRTGTWRVTASSASRATATAGWIDRDPARRRRDNRYAATLDPGSGGVGVSRYLGHARTKAEALRLVAEAFDGWIGLQPSTLTATRD